MLFFVKWHKMGISYKQYTEKIFFQKRIFDRSPLLCERAFNIHVPERLCQTLLNTKVWTVLRGNWEHQSKKPQHTDLPPDTYCQETPKVLPLHIPSGHILVTTKGCQARYFKDRQL